MPRYFFNVREGDTLLEDPEGSDLPDEAAARAYAIKSARSLLMAEVREGRLPLRDAIEVTDERGRPVLCITYGEAVEHV